MNVKRKVSVPFERLMNRQLYCIVLHFPVLIHLFSVFYYILVTVTHILTKLFCFVAHSKVGGIQIFEAFHDIFTALFLSKAWLGLKLRTVAWTNTEGKRYYTVLYKFVSETHSARWLVQFGEATVGMDFYPILVTEETEMVMDIYQCRSPMHGISGTWLILFPSFCIIFYLYIVESLHSSMLDS